MIKRLIVGLSISAACFAASVENGANLYDGTKSFENGAVSCVVCHNVNSSAVISGGTLAMDLTGMGGTFEYSLGSVENMSSPVMQEAYKGKPLTKEEIADLDAFVLDAVNNPGSAGGENFVMMGVAGAVIMFIILSLLGNGRRKQSVNQELYDRQQVNQTQSSQWRDA
ncbi:MAG: hypothetical protein L3I99_00805 [Sulfurimonas sp.]|nr:hypothetical protein [Sulfurimonas sp.]